MDKAMIEKMHNEFVRLEDRFLELTQHVPLVASIDDSRYSIASPEAADFGLECGTWIETLMRELLLDPRWDNKVPGIQEARAQKELNIGVCREVMADSWVSPAAATRTGGSAVPRSCRSRNGRIARVLIRSGSDSTRGTSMTGLSSRSDSR